MKGKTMNLRDMIIREEGCKLEAYQDTLGVWTCGFGSTGTDVGPETRWTMNMAESRLDVDLAKAKAGIFKSLPWFGRLNEQRAAALVGMVYQMGMQGVLGFPKMLAAMREERWADAKKAALDSLWAKQTPARAKRMAEQILTGEWQ